MNAKDYPRAALTAFIMVLLGYAAVNHYSPGVEETIKAIALIAVGYWLGSSKGSADKSEELSRQSRETQTVMIDQPEGHAVPVEEQP